MADTLEDDWDEATRQADVRLTWLRRLRKGTGVRREIDGFDFAAFGVADHAELVRLLEEAIESMPQSRETAAVREALCLADSETIFADSGRNLIYSLYKDSLSERRQWLAEQENISERTVMRLEERGLDQMNTVLEGMVGATAYDWAMESWRRFESAERAAARAGYAFPATAREAIVQARSERMKDLEQSILR